jgi:c-di-GMP-binding flagellar brake protein YcgR
VTDGTTVYLYKLDKSGQTKKRMHALAQRFLQHAEGKVKLSVQFLVIRDLNKRQLKNFCV